MASAAGPNVVEDGLLLALDAGNSKSWNVGISSDWTDNVGGNNGTLVNGTFHNDGPFAGAGYVEFDGTNDYLTVAGSSDFAFGTGDFTIEFFIYSNASSPNLKDVFSNPGGIQLFFVSGKLRYNHALVADLLDTDNVIVQNKWTHCALVRSSGTTRWYIDGIQNSGSYSDSKDWTQTTTWYVGSYDGTQQYSNIYISNLRIIKGTALYTSNFAVPTKSLTAITNTSLLTCQGNTITDASSSGHTITANGNISLTKEPFTGAGAFEFDGTGDYLSIANNADFRMGSDPFTIEGYLYIRSTAGEDGIVNLYGYSNNRRSYEISLNSGNFRFRTDNNGSGATTVFNYSGTPLQQWFHFAVVKSSTTGTLYINGIQVASGTADATLYNNTTDDLIIGNIGPYGGSYYFNGFISNLRIIKGTALYTSAFTPPTRKLDPIENTALLTCQGQNIKDYSSSAHAITVNGDSKPTIVSSSFEFDGTDDYIDVSSSALGLSAGTLCFWIKSSVVKDIYNTHSGSYNQNSLYGSGASILLRISDGIAPGDVVISSSLVFDGNFHWVCTQWTTGGERSIWVDGTKRASLSGTRQYTPGTTLEIGYKSWSAGYYNGIMSNIMSFNRALSASEMQQNYNALKGRYGY